jgi:hypothetical protein
MPDQTSVQTSACATTGTLIFKDHCYALRQEDGAETWLELDLSPAHLIDRLVQVEGVRHARQFICVARIGPI